VAGDIGIAESDRGRTVGVNDSPTLFAYNQRTGELRFLAVFYHRDGERWQGLWRTIEGPGD
jgi:hypothetical protein